MRLMLFMSYVPLRACLVWPAAAGCVSSAGVVHLVWCSELSVIGGSDLSQQEGEAHWLQSTRADYQRPTFPFKFLCCLHARAHYTDIPDTPWQVPNPGSSPQAVITNFIAAMRTFVMNSAACACPAAVAASIFCCRRSRSALSTSPSPASIMRIMWEAEHKL